MPKKSKVEATEGTKILFEEDIIKFLKNDKKLDIEVGFLTETGSNISRWLDTGSYTWNFLSSGRLMGGLPYGRISECFGEPYTGKSLLACQLAVKGQQDGAMIIYFDPERSVDEETIKRLGGNPNAIIAPKKIKTIEKFNQTFIKIIERVASYSDKERPPIVVILDSLAMLSTEQEINKPDKVDYTKPKKIRQFFRMYMDDCARNNIHFFVINQVYDNIGVMFGPAKKASGGQGLTYASSQRFGLLSPTIEKEGGSESEGSVSDVIATKVKAKTYKNRASIPFRQVYIRSTYKDGVDRYGGLWELLTNGENGKVTGFNIIKRAQKDNKGVFKESKTGTYFIWPGVVTNEDGTDKGFQRKSFVEKILKPDEERLIEIAQKTIDERNKDAAPDFSELTDEEKVLAGVEDGEILSDKELLAKEIKESKETSEEEG